jgi:hypothetical protein
MANARYHMRWFKMMLQIISMIIGPTQSGLYGIHVTWRCDRVLRKKVLDTHLILVDLSLYLLSTNKKYLCRVKSGINIQGWEACTCRHSFIYICSAHKVPTKLSKASLSSVSGSRYAH